MLGVNNRWRPIHYIAYGANGRECILQGNDQRGIAMLQKVRSFLGSHIATDGNNTTPELVQSEPVNEEIQAIIEHQADPVRMSVPCVAVSLCGCI